MSRFHSGFESITYLRGIFAGGAISLSLVKGGLGSRSERSDSCINCRFTFVYFLVHGGTPGGDSRVNSGFARCHRRLHRLLKCGHGLLLLLGLRACHEFVVARVAAFVARRAPLVQKLVSPLMPLLQILLSYLTALVEFVFSLI